MLLYFDLYRHRAHADLHSFPTRRSSDLEGDVAVKVQKADGEESQQTFEHVVMATGHDWPETTETKPGFFISPRSEEHTSELQSREKLVCRLLLEKKK